MVLQVAGSPMDVIKARVMNQRLDAAGKGTVYSGTIDCAMKSVKAEGLLALWRGFWPNYARLGPHNVIMFLVIEQVRAAFRTFDGID